jgi:2-C-methyl-D-erythritol 4-phosphate cytidylyltransferase
MNTAVLLAAGSGKRMAGAVADKILAPLASGACPIALCLRAFVQSGCIGSYVIVTRDQEQRRAIAEIAKEGRCG